jgi:hypothetical protein
MDPFDTSDPRDDELEARLRSERPRPSAELVDRLAAARRPPRVRGALTVRLAIAAVLTVVLAGAAVTAGDGSPLQAFDQAVTAVQGTSSAPPSGNSNGSGANTAQPSTSSKAGPGNDQYQEKITICHRGNSPNNPGETLTLPRQAAEQHLAQHKYDTRGPCPAPPPPPNVTICHRASKNDKGQTLTLPQPAAEQHLKDHKYDTRGACPK